MSGESDVTCKDISVSIVDIEIDPKVASSEPVNTTDPPTKVTSSDVEENVQAADTSEKPANGENVDDTAESKPQPADDRIRTPGENFVPSPEREALYKKKFDKMKSALTSYGMRARKRPEVVKVTLPLLKTKENIDDLIPMPQWYLEIRPLEDARVLLSALRKVIKDQEKMVTKHVQPLVNLKDMRKKTENNFNKDEKKWKAKGLYDLLRAATQFYERKLKMFESAIKLKEFDCEYHSTKYRILKRTELNFGTKSFKELDDAIRQACIQCAKVQYSVEAEKTRLLTQELEQESKDLLKKYQHLEAHFSKKESKASRQKRFLSIVQGLQPTGRMIDALYFHEHDELSIRFSQFIHDQRMPEGLILGKWLNETDFSAATHQDSALFFQKLSQILCANYGLPPKQYFSCLRLELYRSVFSKSHGYFLPKMLASVIGTDKAFVISAADLAELSPQEFGISRELTESAKDWSCDSIEHLRQVTIQRSPQDNLKSIIDAVESIHRFIETYTKLLVKTETLLRPFTFCVLQAHLTTPHQVIQCISNYLPNKSWTIGQPGFGFSLFRASINYVKERTKEVESGHE